VLGHDKESRDKLQLSGNTVIKLNMEFNIFRKSDKYTIDTELSFNEVMEVFYKNFEISEKVYRSFWDASIFPYHGIFSMPNKFVLKKSSKIPNTKWRNVIYVEINNSDMVSLKFTIDNFLTKLAILFVWVFYAFAGGMILYHSFSTEKLLLTIIIMIGLGVILNSFFYLYHFLQKRYFERLL
jgi:hypothetical protein